MKFIILVNIFSNIISCNGQDKNISVQNYEPNKTSKINFLDKNYFRYYELDATSQYPQFWFNDKKMGEFSVMYLAKDIALQKEWEQFDWKNNLVMEEEATPEYSKQLNKLIKNKLEPNIDSYYIIAEFVSSKYIKKNRDYIDYIYPYKKTYYLCNKDNKSWNIIKEKTINDGSDEKNITKLSELNSMMGISQSNNDKDKTIIDTVIASVPLDKLDGRWALDCKSDKYISLEAVLNNAQFTIPNRFSMNAELKKIE